MTLEVSGAILAGGQSRRMGHDKAALMIAGESLLARTVRLVRTITSDVAVIGPAKRSALAPNVPIIPDRWPDQGPLGGIATALQALSGGVILVVGCDMPFLNPSLLRHLIALASGYDAVVVRADGQAHPLHAVYQQSCSPVLEKQLIAGDLRVHQFLARLRVRYVEGTELDRFDPWHLSTFNANTPEEWEQALKLSAAPDMHS